MDQFADLATREVVSLYTGYQPNKVWTGMKYLGIHEYGGKSLVDAVDWTTKEVVTPVKKHEQCGSCGAFSTTISLEDNWFTTAGTLSP